MAWRLNYPLKEMTTRYLPEGEELLGGGETGKERVVRNADIFTATPELIV
jgi:hypothetical protein